MFRTSLLIAVIATTIPLSCVEAADQSNRKPNIVFILADDLGIGDVHCYGGDRCKIETPNIDALARDGMRFTDAHVNASVCMPTRMAIMTGRYPWRVGRGRSGGPWGFVGCALEPGTFTLATLLRRSGYRTGYVGKWHLGTEMTTRDGKVQNETNVDYEKPIRIGPPQYDFDESFILPGSLDMYPYAFARNNIWQGQVTAQKGWSAFNRVGPAEKDFLDHEVLETFYSEAESFIEMHNDEKPFFLYLALTAPHTPISPGKPWHGKSELGVYGDFVMEVDHAVQRIVNALQRRGALENTLLLFSSDHGAAPYAGNILKATPGQIHALEQDHGHFPSGPHRGYKFSVYEGGLRVPLIAHWPEVVKPGSRCDALVGLCDLMATFADIVGFDLSESDAPDSISFANLLRDPAAVPQRNNLIMQSIGPFVVRDGSWKLCVCPGSGSNGRFGNQPTPEQAWGDALAQFDGAPRRADLVRAPFVQLFDLSNDPHEDENLAGEQPNRVQRMIELLRTQIVAGRSTPGPDLQSNQPNINQRLPQFVREQIE